MKSLFWLVAVFAGAVALAVLGRVNEGLVVLAVPPWRIELSLVLFVVALIVAFMLAYAGTRLVMRTLELPAQVRDYRARRGREQAQGALAGALLAYFEGRYARAEKEAAAAWEAGAAPGVAALVAARAAHELREFERRNRWLERAGGAGEALHAARHLTQAELALEERDYVGARNALTSQHGAGPRNIATARMLLRAERGAHNWEEVLRLASTLGKRDAISPAVAGEYRVQAHVELLARAAGDAEMFRSRWRRVSSDDQLHPRVASAAAKHATALGEAALAREILEKSLAKEWGEARVALYGELPALEPQALDAEARARLERAERWLPEHPEDPQLLVALGRLCAQAGLWGKARDYLEASLTFDESRVAHLELAKLAERDGRAGDAQRHYRMAAELA